MIKFLDLNKQYLQIKNEIDLAIESVILDSAFIGGKYVEEFENEFACFSGVNNCIGVGNGTDALEIAIEVLGFMPGSEIIVPSNSFIASSEAVTRTGCKVVFCDCNMENYTISIDDVKKKITPKTAAIIAVHLYGHPCDMDSLLMLSAQNNIKIIEDCAQAHGALYKGKKVGSIGDIAAYSFYPGKNLGAYGDGGAIVTNNDALAEKCRMIANHGRVKKYNHEFEGRNSRLDGIQAAILIIKLRYLNKWIARRIEIADKYSEGLKKAEKIILPKREEWAKHAYHLYVIRSKKRDDLKRYLKQKEIQTGIHYPIALPKLNAYEYIDQSKEFMFANQIDEELLSLPIGEHLEDDEVNYIIDCIRDFDMNDL